MGLAEEAGPLKRKWRDTKIGRTLQKLFQKNL